MTLPVVLCCAVSAKAPLPQMRFTARVTMGLMTYFCLMIYMSQIRFLERDGIKYIHVTSVTQFFPKLWKEAWQRKVGFEESDEVSQTDRKSVV